MPALAHASVPRAALSTIAGALIAACFATAPVAAAAPPLSNADAVLADLGKQLQDPSRPVAERLQLIQVFREWATAQVRAPLLAVLDDPAAEIREAAAAALGWAGNREAVDALRERLQSPTETTAVKAAVLQALGRIGEPSSRAVVVAAASQRESDIREAALWSLALGSLQSPEDRPRFLRQLVGDQAADSLFRSQAAQALGEAKDKEAVEVLARILEHEPPIQMPIPPPNAPQQDIAYLRYRQTRDVRAWVARALAMIQAPSTIPLLLKSAEEREDFFVRFMSVEGLVYWNVPEAIPVLHRRLQDQFADIRLTALIGLAKAGDRSGLERVLARLSDPVPRVRAQAVITLAELGDPRVRPAIQLVHDTDDDPIVQRAAEAALAKLPK